MSVQEDSADLPPPDTRRWVARRKAQVVLAIAQGTLSFEEACRRYGLTAEELATWSRRADRFGIAGLRTTRVQQYRRVEESRTPGKRAR